MSGGEQRLYWLDNLRSVVIALVVLYHVGGVYESAGLWASFWIVDDPATLTWVGIMGIMFDIMVMPLMFYIAGYLVPSSLNRRSPGEFILGKIKRLMIPWLIAVVTLIPLYKFLFLYSRGLPQEVWTSYFHFTAYNNQNWLWFLPVLFLFNLLYLAGDRLKLQFPKLSLSVLIVIAGILVLISNYLLGVWLGFRSWTHSFFLDFENERILLYFTSFLVGALSYERQVFAKETPGKILYNIANGTAWIPVTVHIFARLYPFFYPEQFAVTPLYRLIWWLSFDLSVLLLMFVMLGTFWRYFNGSGKTWRVLNANSYGVYIIHVILIGLFGTLLLQVETTAWIKYPALFILTWIGSNLLVWGYRQLRSETG